MEDVNPSASDLVFFHHSLSAKKAEQAAALLAQLSDEGAWCDQEWSYLSAWLACGQEHWDAVL